MLAATIQSNTYLLGINCVMGIILEAPGDIEVTQLLLEAACNYTNGRDNSKNSHIGRVYV